MSRYPHLLLYLSATARKGLHEIRNKLAHSGFSPLLVRLSLVNPIPRIIAKLQSTINHTLSLTSNKRTFFFDTSTMRLYSIYIIIQYIKITTMRKARHAAGGASSAEKEN